MNKTLELLLQLAEEVQLKDAIEQMFSGKKINETENRAVLHVALRNQSEDSILEEGHDVIKEADLRLIQEFPEISDDGGGEHHRQYDDCRPQIVG